MDKWFKDILPDKDPYHNRGRDQMRKKGGPDFKCLCFFMHPSGQGFVQYISNVNDKVNGNTTQLPIPSRNSTRYVLIVVEIEDVLDRQCSVLTPRLVMYIVSVIEESSFISETLPPNLIHYQIKFCVKIDQFHVFQTFLHLK